MSKTMSNNTSNNTSNNMSNSHITGMVLLGLGAVLLILGATASLSLADRLSSTFMGHLSRSTMWYIFGGIASTAGGLLLAIGAFGSAKA